MGANVFQESRIDSAMTKSFATAPKQSTGMESSTWESTVRFQSQPSAETMMIYFVSMVAFAKRTCELRMFYFYYCTVVFFVSCCSSFSLE
jgi:hypothetical protein